MNGRRPPSSAADGPTNPIPWNTQIKDRRRILWGAAILMLCLSAVYPSAGMASGNKLFRIGTGGLAGVYHPIGKLLAQAITGFLQDGERNSPLFPGCIGVAQTSGGSISNVRALSAGEIEAGLVQADVAFAAFTGGAPFEGDASGGALRAIASLYPEKFQIVTRREAQIQSVSGLRGRAVSIDEAGSGTLSVTRIILNAHGMSEADFTPFYLKPDFAVQKIRDGVIDGFTVMSGVPMNAVMQVSDIGLHLVPIDPEIAARISSRYPYLVPGEIPANAYPGVPATPTIQVHALLLVRANTDEALAYRLTRMLWSEETRALLACGHPQGRAIARARALEGLSVPLHPGAIRYYQESGLALPRPPAP